MKGISIYSVLLMSVLSLGSCDYNHPAEPQQQTQDSPDVQNVVTISALKAMYRGQATTITDNVNLLATVSSNDSEGNLYKSFYVEDETGGLELKLGMGNISTLYPQGAKVLIHCKGMTLGKYGDQINLGYASQEARYETAYYPELMVTREAMELVSTGELSPRKLTISTLSKQYAGTLIELEGVQFIASELGQTYANAEDKRNQANVNRTLTDASGKTIIVRTSSYAKFAGKRLPEGSGKVIALLTYFRDTPQLVILRERDVELNNPRF